MLVFVSKEGPRGVQLNLIISCIHIIGQKVNEKGVYRDFFFFLVLYDDVDDVGVGISVGDWSC